MKKVFLVALVALFGFSLSAQEGLKVGANLGLPVGDAGDVSGFSIGLDAQYMFETAGEFDLGVATGFTNAFGKSIGDDLISIEIDDIQFLPLAGVARYSVSEEVSIGTDLGYALGINDGNDGGSWTTINLGVLFSL